jgi:hypothetical protein
MWNVFIQMAVHLPSRVATCLTERSARTPYPSQVFVRRFQLCTKPRSEQSPVNVELGSSELRF